MFAHVQYRWEVALIEAKLLYVCVVMCCYTDKNVLFYFQLAKIPHVAHQETGGRNVTQALMNRYKLLDFKATFLKPLFWCLKDSLNHKLKYFSERIRDTLLPDRQLL